MAKQKDGDVTEVKLKVDGQEPKAPLEIFSVMVHKEVNRIPSARIAIRDGDIPSATYELSNQDDFKPGARVEIFAGPADELESIFSGLIVKHSIRSIG